jgi:DNA helicase-2/ATP-dependent DNA helicase PcrA
MEAGVGEGGGDGGAAGGDFAPAWLSVGGGATNSGHAEHAGHSARDHAARRDNAAARDAAAWQDELLHGLTAPQREAVQCTEGPLLVLAAAGSGKTRVITRRIAYLVSMGIQPWNILALTFTNKAAGEMRERVMHLLNPSGDPQARAVRGLTVTTFHALCARLLRRYAEQVGLKQDYTIYDSGDQAALVKKVIEGMQLSTSNFQPRSVLGAISNAKNQLLGPGEYEARAFDFASRNIAKIYLGYEKALRQANAVDFDDLLMLTAKLLQGHAAVREELRGRWQYLLVDEYQDTNKAQFVIASLIAGEGGKTPAPERRGTKLSNICVVGDPDQAIYGWRGADIGNILDFEAHYPGCRTIKLGENFRSTAPILKVADTLIQHNKRRKHKDLFTSKEGGAKVQAVLCRDERHEAALVVDWLRVMKEGARDEETKRPRDGVASTSSLGLSVSSSLSWKDMAIFYRTNALSRVLEEALRGANVPYTIARGTAFYDREEIKNALGYLRVVANQADDVSLARIVNTPSRGISDATWDKIEAMGQRSGRAAFECMAELTPTDAEALGVTSRAIASVQKFVGLVREWTGSQTFLGEQLKEGSLAELVDRVVKESGLEAMYQKQAAQSQNESDAERLDNLAELVSSAREFEMEYDPAGDAANDVPRRGDAGTFGTTVPPTLPAVPPLLALLRAFLESVALVADADSIDPALGSVTLMTLHAAKGLEFPVVAMVGLEEGLMPHTRAVMSASEDEMEEERRLCFVGVTRAMRRLHLTAAKYRTLRGNLERTIPSRFLSEMPQSELQVSDQSDGADAHEDSWDDQPRRVGGATGVGGLRPPGPARPSTPSTSHGFSPGMKVRHPQFGMGVIRTVTSGGQPRAIIEFKDAGTKTLVLEYARLTRV